MVLNTTFFVGAMLTASGLIILLVARRVDGFSVAFWSPAYRRLHDDQWARAYFETVELFQRVWTPMLGGLCLMAGLAFLAVGVLR